MDVLQAGERKHLTQATKAGVASLAPGSWSEDSRGSAIRHDNSEQLLGKAYDATARAVKQIAYASVVAMAVAGTVGVGISDSLAKGRCGSASVYDSWTTSGGKRRIIANTGPDFYGVYVIAPHDGVISSINDCKPPSYLKELGCVIGIFAPGRTGTAKTFPDLLVDIQGNGSSCITYVIHMAKEDGQNSATLYVKPGDFVKQGTIVGHVGGTGIEMNDVEDVADWSLFCDSGGWSFSSRDGSYSKLNQKSERINPEILMGSKYVPFLLGKKNPKVVAPVWCGEKEGLPKPVSPPVYGRT